MALPRRVQVAPRQFLDYRFVERLKALLAECRLPTSCIELELTESVLQTGAATIRTLEQLRAMDIAVALQVTADVVERLEQFAVLSDCRGMKLQGFLHLALERELVRGEAQRGEDVRVEVLGLRLVGGGAEPLVELAEVFLELGECFGIHGRRRCAIQLVAHLSQ